MIMKEKIILIGYMGSGKTTLGKKLALELKVPFIDSDTEIEKIYDKTIPAFFAEEGENSFREKESAFIASLQNEKAFVLSTGGGMPCFHNNMEALNQLGTTIYLKNNNKTLAERLMVSKNERPLIKGKSKEELIQFIDENIAKREPFYLKAIYTLEPEQQGVLNVYKLLRDQQ